MREKHLFGNRIHCRRPPLRPHRRRLPHRTGPLPPQALRQRIPHRQRPPVLLLTIQSRNPSSIRLPSIYHLPSPPPTIYHLYHRPCISTTNHASPTSQSPTTHHHSHPHPHPQMNIVTA